MQIFKMSGDLDMLVDKAKLPETETPFLVIFNKSHLLKVNGTTKESIHGLSYGDGIAEKAATIANSELTSFNFMWFTARYGYDQVVKDIIEYWRENDIEKFAEHYAQYNSSGGVPLAWFIGLLNDPDVAALIPDEMDVTADYITPIWVAVVDS